MMMRIAGALAVLLSGCGHYYHGYYPGAVALDAPTVVVGSDDSSQFVVGAIVTGSASGEWTSQNGWSGSAGGEASSGESIAADATCSVPRVAASIAVTGNGTGLPGLVGAGVHVACNACSGAGASGATASAGGSAGASVDTIAALSLLGSLSSLSLGGDAVVASSDGVQL